METTTIDGFGVLISIGDEVFIHCDEDKNFWLKPGKITLIDIHRPDGDTHVLIEHSDLEGIWWKAKFIVKLTKKRVEDYVQPYINSEQEIPEQLLKLREYVKLKDE